MSHHTNSRLPVIAFNLNPWDQDWWCVHRILSGLGQRGWPVVCSSGMLSLWHRGGREWAGAPWLGRFERRNHIWFDRPGRLAAHWPRIRLWEKFACQFHARRLQKEARDGRDIDVIALLFHPEFWPYARHLNARYVVYFANDAYSLLPGWTPELAAKG